MHALANAGQQTNHRYVELTYIVAENEEEEEQRDYSRVSKVTKAVLNHANYCCIGNSTCLKQKNIRKVFPATLKQCEERNKINLEAANSKKKAGSGSGNQNPENDSSFASIQSKQSGYGKTFKGTLDSE